MTHKAKTGLDSEKECIDSHPKSKPPWRWLKKILHEHDRS
ncbi:hypothetical protein D623_10017811 [Myotis brandtii]|uniref:Uncharacterized protein n=1 Tax=Myotis brandtii TaxID=109478 RepID=S7Q5Q6_MYOBR|nr:hypothetical protein D623_10017811 [Myotis brandtii]